MKPTNIQKHLTETLRRAAAPFAKDIKAFFAKDAQLRAEVSSYNSFAAEDAFEQLRARAVSGDAEAMAEIKANPRLSDWKRKYVALEEIADQARTNHIATNRKHFIAAAEQMLKQIDGIAKLAQAQLDEATDAMGEPRVLSAWAEHRLPALQAYLQSIVRGADADLGEFIALVE